MTDPKYLPEFSKAWLAQWQRASAELARVRDQELRALDESAAMANEPLRLPMSAELSGLVTQQRWFMRQQLLQLLDADHSSG